jgi:uncharacterized cysteine cluster protein YcgN (CxxCxxCC family)
VSASAPAPEIPFWRKKRLGEMNLAEWESLCDGCARCCLQKLEDLDNGEIAYTDVACGLLDLETCRCRDYTHRTIHVSDCVELTAPALLTLRWLPPTCAYRLLHEGKDLPAWHPLLSGDPETVARAGVSVLGRVISERDVVDPETRIVDWPAEGVGGDD